MRFTVTSCSCCNLLPLLMTSYTRDVLLCQQGLGTCDRTTHDTRHKVVREAYTGYLFYLKERRYFPPKAFVPKITKPDGTVQLGVVFTARVILCS